MIEVVSNGASSQRTVRGALFSARMLSKGRYNDVAMVTRCVILKQNEKQVPWTLTNHLINASTTDPQQTRLQCCESNRCMLI